MGKFQLEPPPLNDRFEGKFLELELSWRDSMIDYARVYIWLLLENSLTIAFCLVMISTGYALSNDGMGVSQAIREGRDILPLFAFITGFAVWLYCIYFFYKKCGIGSKVDATNRLELEAFRYYLIVRLWQLTARPMVPVTIVYILSVPVVSLLADLI